MLGWTPDEHLSTVRVLLDECLPAGLHRSLTDHEVTTVQRMGWAGTSNGALLSLIEDAGFDAFLTVDKRLALQQRIQGRQFGVIAMRAPSNDIADLVPLAPAILAALKTLSRGQFVQVG